ncbi:flagellar hook protein [Campylobacter showae]|uniref:Flagellar hook-basal body protein n=1 Tax=Campylobacter showae RM3277 TaxID=553219 RepID=C6RIY8_9BACT|nr:flagellar hook-basal body complex protein [Campylobacter showae]EET78569.1 flagellar hook-basal body protein [Campylobacter showae RM3277]QCD49912.1 flagellar hook protein [Campylobacter showae]
MVRSLYNGVSGVRTQGFSMDVWANNIANINNVGFTASIPEFKSIFYQTSFAAGNNPTQDQVGLGATGMTTALSFYKQGPFMKTDNVLDMAIGGKGFFGVTNGSGTYYTRAGSFGVDKERYLVTNQGNYVLGTQNTLTQVTPSQGAIEAFGRVNGRAAVTQAYTLGADTTDLDVGDIGSQGKIRLPEFLYLPTKPTSKVTFKGNLDSSFKTEPTTLPVDNATYNSSIDNPSRTINLRGRVTADDTITRPRKGDMVTVTVTDANGKTAEFSAPIDENGNWSISQKFERDFDLTTAPNLTAKINTTKEAANQEKFVTELLNADGTKNKLELTLTKRVPQSANGTVWDAAATVKDASGAVVSNTNGELNFDHEGRLVNSTLSALDNNGSQVELDFGTPVAAGQIYSGVTSTSQAKSISIAQDGVREGILKDYYTNDSGNILAQFTNGQVRSVGKVALYHFQNEQGLAKMGDNIYSQSANSGAAFFYKDAGGKSIYGAKLASSMLEQSNVDLAQALTEVIVTQKAYDANAKSITTSNEMLQRAIELKR